MATTKKNIMKPNIYKDYFNIIIQELFNLLYIQECKANSTIYAGLIKLKL